MTKRQFMEELRSSLEGMVSQAVIQENMNYYEDYINEQIRNGKNEQDVLNELGSPRLIARSIIDAKGEDDDYVQTEYYEEEQDEGTPEDNELKYCPHCGAKVIKYESYIEGQIEIANKIEEDYLKERKRK